VKVIGSRGPVGVDVFFVLSGFLITTLMLRELSRTGRISIRAFYIRRFLRIIPAYATLLFVVFVLERGGWSELTSRDWIAASTYTVNFLQHPAWEIGHVWSLSIEEHFYLAWPLLMATTAGLMGRRAALFAMIFCFVARWVIILFAPAYIPMAELWTFTRIDGIATGCLLAFLAWDATWRARLDRFGSNNWAVAAVASCLLASLVLSRSGKFSVGVAYTLNACCIALLCWAIVQRSDSLLGRLFNHWSVRWIGVASYSLYLWQQLFLDHGKDSLLCSFPQNVVFAFAAALLSHWVVEKPFLKLKARFAAEPTTPRPSVALNGEAATKESTGAAPSSFVLSEGA
jgi:peptidoglycan/LPS O-acetylase OafA/YrhL